ncbi:MAG TPA: single-stranded DNA-binding protein, partial [Candidatus Paceibacterota bacterium]
SKDPKMQYDPKGSAVTHLNVAVTSGFGDKEKTTWFSLVSFGKQAEVLNQYLSKGKRLFFTAELSEVRTFEMSDNTTGVSVDAKIQSFQFLDAGSKESASEPEEF